MKPWAKQYKDAVTIELRGCTAFQAVVTHRGVHHMCFVGPDVIPRTPRIFPNLAVS